MPFLHLPDRTKKAPRVAAKAFAGLAFLTNQNQTIFKMCVS